MEIALILKKVQVSLLFCLLLVGILSLPYIIDKLSVFFRKSI